MTPALVLLALLGKPAAGAPRPAPPPAASFDALLGSARRDGKPVVVEFFADWCGPCRMVEQHLLPAAEVKQALEGYHFGRLDVETGSGLDLERRYSVHALPTFLVVDPDGREVSRYEGAPPSPAVFRGWLEAQAPRAAGVEHTLAGVARHPDDPDVLLAAGDRLIRAGRIDEGEKLLARAEAADKDNAGGVAARAGWLRGLSVARRAALAARRDFLADYVARYPRGENAAAAMEALAVLPVLTPEVRRRVFGAAVDDARRDPDRLNNLVYLCLRAGALDEAQRAAEALAELRPRDGNSWDTLAEVHHYRGNRALALRNSTRALDLAPDGDEKRVMIANRARYQRGGREPCPDVERITGPKWEE